MNDATDDQAATAADGVGKDARGASGKEVGHDSGDDEIARNGSDEHADERTDGSEDEAHDDGVGGIREEDGAIEGGLGARNEPLRDALEGGDDVIEQLPNAHHQDIEADDEGAALQERLDEIVDIGAHVERLTNCSRLVRPSDNGRYKVEDDHYQEDRDVRVVQEVEALGNLEVLSRILLLTDQLGDTGRNHVSDGAEVTQGNVIGAGDLAYDGLSDSRHEGREAASHDRGEKNQGEAPEAEEPGEHDRER